MNAYTLLRKVHLYSGLAVLAFVIVYFVSGYPMIHPTWFPNPEAVKETRIEPLRYNGPKDPPAYSEYLQKAFDLRGQVTRRRRQKDGGWEFRYSRPGTVYEAVVAPAGDIVRITTVRDNAVQTIIAFHELHGYGGGKLYNLWAILLDLVSFSLIVFAFSGVYLWFKLTKKRLLGWILLGVSYGYAAATVLYLMYAP